MNISCQNLTPFLKKIKIMAFEPARKLQNLSLLRIKFSREVINDCTVIFNLCIVVKTLIQTPTRWNVLNLESDTLYESSFQSLTSCKNFTSNSYALWVIIFKTWSFVKDIFQNLTFCIYFNSKSDTLPNLYFRVGHVVNISIQTLTRSRRVRPKPDMLCIFQFQI